MKCHDEQRTSKLVKEVESIWMENAKFSDYCCNSWHVETSGGEKKAHLDEEQFHEPITENLLACTVFELGEARSWRFAGSNEWP